jgi:steroid 5-alpha reductase family enzyme
MVYVWVAAFAGGLNDRQVLMASLVSLWGIRLTFNFARKGGYSWRFWEGEEDYRWAELRKNPVFANSFVWFIFNLSFISGY